MTALLASFMSGMAGKHHGVQYTVFTYDIYQTYLVKNREDRHYLHGGPHRHPWGATVIACASSFIVLYFNNLMDYMALISILFISPFFMIFLLGMVWKRPSASPRAFTACWGGLTAALAQYILYRAGVLHFASPMAANLWSAGLGFVRRIDWS